MYLCIKLYRTETRERDRETPRLRGSSSINQVFEALTSEAFPEQTWTKMIFTLRRHFLCHVSMFVPSSCCLVSVSTFYSAMNLHASIVSIDAQFLFVHIDGVDRDFISNLKSKLLDHDFPAPCFLTKTQQWRCVRNSLYVVNDLLLARDGVGMRNTVATEPRLSSTEIDRLQTRDDEWSRYCPHCSTRLRLECANFYCPGVDAESFGETYFGKRKRRTLRH